MNYTYKFAESMSKIMDIEIICLPETSDQEIHGNLPKSVHICGPMLGIKHTEATKLKMSMSRKGRKVWNKGITGYKNKPFPKESIEKMRNSLSLNWKIITPEKETIYIRNLLQYCRDNKLDPGAMHRVSTGLRTHHKNFKCIKF